MVCGFAVVLGIGVGLRMYDGLSGSIVISLSLSLSTSLCICLSLSLSAQS